MKSKACLFILCVIALCATPTVWAQLKSPAPNVADSFALFYGQEVVLRTTRVSYIRLVEGSGLLPKVRIECRKCGFSEKITANLLRIPIGEFRIKLHGSTDKPGTSTKVVVLTPIGRTPVHPRITVMETKTASPY